MSSSGTAMRPPGSGNEGAGHGPASLRPALAPVPCPAHGRGHPPGHHHRGPGKAWHLKGFLARYRLNKATEGARLPALPLSLAWPTVMLCIESWVGRRRRRSPRQFLRCGNVSRPSWRAI
jgi:hypothetical protein